MTDLEELYQEVVMDHNRKPRNYRELDEPDHTANGYNPFCGDVVTLYLKMDDDSVIDIGFQGKGCAISRASASLMSESVKGKTRTEIKSTYDAFHAMMIRGPEADFDEDGLGDLEVLSGVAEFPTRVKCATLAWHTLQAALRDQNSTVSTEE